MDDLLMRSHMGPNGQVRLVGHKITAATQSEDRVAAKRRNCDLYFQVDPAGFVDFFGNLVGGNGVDIHGLC